MRYNTVVMSQTRKETGTSLRYRGITFMSGTNVNAIIANDTRTEVPLSYSAPQSSKIGTMSLDEILKENQDGWTPHPHHRSATLPQLIGKAIALVTGTPFTRQAGTVSVHGADIPHMGTVVGQRILVQREGKAAPYVTLPRAKAGTIIPSDLPRVDVATMRTTIASHLRVKGLPTEHSLRVVARSVRDAEQFIVQHGGDKNHKIKKAPLASMNHEQQMKRQNSRRPTRNIVGADGIQF